MFNERRFPFLSGQVYYFLLVIGLTRSTLEGSADTLRIRCVSDTAYIRFVLRITYPRSLARRRMLGCGTTTRGAGCGTAPCTGISFEGGSFVPGLVIVEHA